ncbi:hypothetical protein AB4516_18185 [Vibrio sp. 10N.222.54.F12]|uniref:hypothetical protein n=1 Tax=Vibrio TaxID=662 RepID=UPI000C840C20|nr:hypothetical protein [Vibrio tasmaniensis]PML13906.1 hypothetical protein BCT83_18220 [Vibrio tasmaniensis]
MGKHETINSVIGILGLIVASITAYHQFMPESDQLELEVSSILTSVPLKQYYNFEDGISDEKLKISGPFFWKITAYNSLDRTVTIKDIDTKLFSDNGGFITYSDMNLGIFNRKLDPLSLPLSINANEAKVILVGLKVPIVNEASCFSSENTRSDIERCYYEKGYDLFGNTVTKNSPNSFSWDSFTKAPVFLSTIRTGDNSKIYNELSFYPFAN